jgi:hypothetical protein
MGRLWRRIGPLRRRLGALWRHGPVWYPVTEVNQYDVATVEASLYDVKTQRLVWAATTETFNPNSVAQETAGYADIIIKQLAARGIIAASAK